MSSRERSKEWYDRALEQNDEYVKFILLYIALEVCTKSSFNHIRNISQVPMIKEKFFSKINLEYLEELKSALDQKPLQNVQFPSDDQWSGRLTSTNDFTGIVEFIIRARNNLVHGDKLLDKKRDFFVVTAGNKILKPLVEAIMW